MKTKTVITIGLISIFFSCENTKNIENDLSLHKLSGNIKSVKETSFEAVERFGEITKGKRVGEVFGKRDYYILYNKEGNMLEDNRYKSNGKLSYKSTFEYNDNGKIIGVNDYNSNEVLTEKQIYSYDNKGYLVENNTYASDGSLKSKTKYKYDYKGNIIEKDVYDSSGDETSRETYKFDDKGNQIEEYSYYCELKWISEYDDKGNRIRVNCHDSNGKKVRKWIFIYDLIGNKIEEIDSDSDGNRTVNTTYKYDNNRNIIEVYSINPIASLKGTDSYIYEYDNQGNWVKRIDSYNGFVKYIIIREIMYY